MFTQEEANAYHGLFLFESTSTPLGKFLMCPYYISLNETFKGYTFQREQPENKGVNSLIFGTFLRPTKVLTL